jgi:hypothetical protein
LLFQCNSSSRTTAVDNSTPKERWDHNLLKLLKTSCDLIRPTLTNKHRINSLSHIIQKLTHTKKEIVWARIFLPEDKACIPNHMHKEISSRISQTQDLECCQLERKDQQQQVEGTIRDNPNSEWTRSHLVRKTHQHLISKFQEWGQG